MVGAGAGGQNSGKFQFRVLSGKIKTAGNSLKSTANTAAAGIASQVKAPWKRENGSRVLERLEKKLHEELLRLFNDSGSFYFMLSGDITNSLQRQYSDKELRPGDPLYIRADDRFFFNKSMLQEIIDLEDSRAEPWILPVIQGFVEIKQCALNEEYVEELQLQPESRLPHYYTLILVSRRSRHRAGTRYKRRGVDESGHTANFVETEQILLYHIYALSFVQIRGSIPVYWSQPGIKYRPPPRLHRDEIENQQAFSTHFQSIFERYGGCVNCISLVERAGREKVLADAFLEHVLIYNHPSLAYISFDFHEHCRGMRFENVSMLLETVEDLINQTGYFWVDPHGAVTRQSGVFRINCVDCLDRTNVVQTAIARKVLENQLAKLGVVQPEMGLCSSEQTVFQWIWANNGDCISKQYAGTNALKGDYTRTGERNLSGLVKDGVNSASRYYLNHIKDTYRQAAIDLVLGSGIGDDLLAQVEQDRPLTAEQENPSATLDHVRTVIEDCKRMLMQDTSHVIASWGLIDADPVTGDPTEEGMDVIFILTPESYYTARYDENIDQIFEYQQVPLSDVTKIEFGVLEQTFNLTGLLNSKSKHEHCFRIHYKIGDQTGFFHMFRSTNLRFFNNTVEPISSEEEKIEFLKGIADSVAVTIEASGLVPDMWFGPLEKKKSRPLDPNSGDNLKVRRLRNAGAQALSTVTTQISKLNPIGKLIKPNSGAGKDFSSSGDSPIRFTDLQKATEHVEPPVMHPGSDFQSLPSMHSPSPSQQIEQTQSSTFQEQPTIRLDTEYSQYVQQPVYSTSPGPGDYSMMAGASLPGHQDRLRAGKSGKMSKSTEDLTNTMENVLMPFARITQGLSALGTNLDTQLSKSCDQFMGIEEAENKDCFSNIDHMVSKGNSGCKSLILSI